MLYSKTYLWVARTLSYRNHHWKNHTINCLAFEEDTGQPYNDNLCLFRALALNLHGNWKLEEITSKTFNAFINKMDGLNFNQFQGVQMNNVFVVREIVTKNILCYESDIVNGNFIGKLARRNMKNLENTVRLLRYSNHICCVNNIKAAIKSLLCPSCDFFFNKASRLESHQTTCSDRGKNLYGKNIYQVRETLFDKLYSFRITYTSEKKLIENLDVFYFESIWIQDNIFKDTNTLTWIGKHIPISLSISSNLIIESIFVQFLTLTTLLRFLSEQQRDWLCKVKNEWIWSSWILKQLEGSDWVAFRKNWINARDRSEHLKQTGSKMSIRMKTKPELSCCRCEGISSLIYKNI